VSLFGDPPLSKKWSPIAVASMAGNWRGGLQRPLRLAPEFRSYLIGKMTNSVIMQIPPDKRLGFKIEIS
jgi:hypothetical protein